MAIATGTVTAISSATVTISVDTNFGCRPCADGAGCGLGPVLALFSRRRNRSVQMPVPDDVALVVGDRIRFHTRADRVAGLAFAGYGVPLAGLLTGAAFVDAFAPAAGDAAAVAGALVGMVAAGVAIRVGGVGRTGPELHGSLTRLPR